MAWIAPIELHDRNDMPVLVRTAQEADAASILLHVEASDRESTFLSREPGESVATREEERMLIRRYEEAPNSLFLLAEQEGKLVGTLMYTGWRWKRMRHTGRFGMSIRKSHWSRGIGRILLDTMIAWARGNGITRKIGLEVQHVNERAIALYRDRGFVEEGRLHREMRIGDQWIDILQMGLWLDDAGVIPDADS
ncbi:putative acetyltransferase [compost metagenome]